MTKSEILIKRIGYVFLTIAAIIAVVIWVVCGWITLSREVELTNYLGDVIFYLFVTAFFTGAIGAMMQV